MSLTSSDLELTRDSGLQTIGIRFPSVPVPPGRKIERAYIQFVVDTPTEEPTMLDIFSHATDDAPAFKSSKFNISSRKKSAGVVRWKPEPWAYPSLPPTYRGAAMS